MRQIRSSGAVHHGRRGQFAAVRLYAAAALVTMLVGAGPAIQARGPVRGPLLVTRRAAVSYVEAVPVPGQQPSYHRVYGVPAPGARLDARVVSAATAGGAPVHAGYADYAGCTARVVLAVRVSFSRDTPWPRDAALLYGAPRGIQVLNGTTSHVPVSTGAAHASRAANHGRHAAPTSAGPGGVTLTRVALPPPARHQVPAAVLLRISLLAKPMQVQAGYNRRRVEIAAVVGGTLLVVTGQRVLSRVQLHLVQLIHCPVATPPRRGAGGLVTRTRPTATAGSGQASPSAASATLPPTANHPPTDGTGATGSTPATATPTATPAGATVATTPTPGSGTPASTPTPTSPTGSASATATATPVVPLPTATAPTSTPTATAPTPTPTAMPTAIATAAPTTTALAITIQNYTFTPSTNVIIAPGTTVIWTNKDTVAHTVSPDTTGGHTPWGAGAGSGPLDQNHTYQWTFMHAGNYAYYCSIHPGMTGTITVSG